MVGASLMAFTVRRKVSMTDAEFASVTVTVIVVAPFWFATGAMLMVRFAPLPFRVMFAFGTRVVFDEVAVTIRSAAGVSTSPTVKAMFPVAVSSLVD